MQDYTTWMWPVLHRHLKMLDSVFMVLDSIPARRGLILDIDIQKLRFCAEALGLEIPENYDLTNPDHFETIRGRIMNAILAKIEDLRPSPVGLNPEFPEYGPIREGGEGKQPRKGGEKR